MYAVRDSQGRIAPDCRTMRDSSHYAPEPPPNALSFALKMLLRLRCMPFKIFLLRCQRTLLLLLLWSVPPDPEILSSVLVCFPAVSAVGMLSSRSIVAMTLR